MLMLFLEQARGPPGTRGHHVSDPCPTPTRASLLNRVYFLHSPGRVVRRVSAHPSRGRRRVRQTCRRSRHVDVCLPQPDVTDDVCKLHASRQR